MRKWSLWLIRRFMGTEIAGYRSRRQALALVALAAALTASPAFAGVMGGVLPGGGLIRSPVHSWKAMKFEHVVRQHTDFSCGAASVATVLKFAYGMPVTAHSVLHGMLSVSNPKTVRQKGFSLYDMQQYVQKRLGMRGVGYRINTQKLIKVRVPVVVLINMGGYKHFVVVRRTTRTRVFVADPALGNRIIDMRKFSREWNGIMFAIIGNGYHRSNPLVGVSAPLGPGDLVTGALPSIGNVVSNQILRFTGTKPTQAF